MGLSTNRRHLERLGPLQESSATGAVACEPHLIPLSGSCTPRVGRPALCAASRFDLTSIPNTLGNVVNTLRRVENSRKWASPRFLKYCGFEDVVGSNTAGPQRPFFTPRICPGEDCGNCDAWPLRLIFGS